MLDILEDWATEYAGWKTFRVDGSTKPEERRIQMKEFNEDNGPDCKKNIIFINLMEFYILICGNVIMGINSLQTIPFKYEGWWCWY